MDRPAEAFSFGPFEVRTRSREVYKHGIKLKLRPQPIRILNELLSRPGELVTREELRERLWSSETFVDFEQSLNTSVKELRAVLGDSATEPRYVETVPRLGYRFIAPVGVLEPAAKNGDSVPSAPTIEPALAEIPIENKKTRLWVWAVALPAVLLAGLLVLRWVSFSSPPKVLRINQLTHSSGVQPWGKINTDGARIFFLRGELDGSSLMQVPVSGGEPQPFSSALRDIRILDISPDRSEFLVEPFTNYGSDMEFWMLPALGGSPHRFSDLAGDDGAFSPDGQKVAFSKVDGIYISSCDGNDVHKIVSLPGASPGLAWNPNGAALRFTLQDPRTLNSSLWEVSTDGSNLHELLPGWNPGSHECCGQWSGDGR